MSRPLTHCRKLPVIFNFTYA